MYFTKVPKAARLLYPEAIWSSKHNARLLLTFDDGPHPDSTPELLACLKNQKLKATFFCLGSQARKYPELVQEIKAEGHALGYHGFGHLNGWKTDPTTYLKDLEDCISLYTTRLFRPAYGRITRQQYMRIRKQQGLDIVFWTHMPGDFDKKVSKNLLANRLSQANKKGNIIVLHDKPSCSSKVCYALSNFQ